MMHPYTIGVDTIRCGPRGDPTFRWRPQGCPYNNAVDESTNRILKAELVHRETFGTTHELRAKLSNYARRRDRGMPHGKAPKAVARKRLEAIYAIMGDKVPYAA